MVLGVAAGYLLTVSPFIRSENRGVLLGGVFGWAKQSWVIIREGAVRGGGRFVLTDTRCLEDPEVDEGDSGFDVLLYPCIRKGKKGDGCETGLTAHAA